MDFLRDLFLKCCLCLCALVERQRDAGLGHHWTRGYRDQSTRRGWFSPTLNLSICLFKYLFLILYLIFLGGYVLCFAVCHYCNLQTLAVQIYHHPQVKLEMCCVHYVLCHKFECSCKPKPSIIQMCIDISIQYFSVFFRLQLESEATHRAVTIANRVKTLE